LKGQQVSQVSFFLSV